MSDRISLPDAPVDARAILEAGGVAAWREPIVIGTYEPAAPTRFPMFLDQRVYQGSSGKVYPLPFIERIGREKQPRKWDAIHIENRWIRLVILPELGGRIQIGFDKTTDYDFFYRNNVIKPALVGLAGPWLSGGVEFNWPQHHRPATHLPVESTIESRPDGSVIVWNSDHDPFARMKGMHGILIRPDSNLIELVVRLSNRTEEVQTFLWWANVAARSGDHYQSFFPTDVQFVADHARRAVTSFPRADRHYYGVDYPARTSAAHPDADRLDFFRNIPVPTSYMVLETQDDFFGGYDHEKQAGFVHWADRTIAPGKKQWTWGNAPFGQAWDRLLTDDDGPYVELMAGVYTDNQPDFSYLAPGQVAAFSQYWFPYGRIGVVVQATREGAIAITPTQSEALRVGVAVTRVHEAVTIRVASKDGATLAERTVSLDPGAPFLEDMLLGGVADRDDIRVIVTSNGSELVAWAPHNQESPEPVVATEPPPPTDIASSDELYLTGVHLAQYRHPTRSPEPYFLELLKRDSGDSRANVRLSERTYHTGDFLAAESFARAALHRLTARNPNPADGEASYRLGLALRRQGRASEAEDAFAKAAWDAKWAGPSQVQLAFSAARRGLLDDAMTRVGAAERAGGRTPRLLCLQATIDFLADRPDDARAILAAALQDDPLDQWALALAGLPMTDSPLTLIDVAVDARDAGDTELALRLLDDAVALPAGPAGNAAPVALYLAAQLKDVLGNPAAAAEYRLRAGEVDATWCFPSGLAAESALRSAIAADEGDGRAHALLGAWLYSVGRRADALAQWEIAIGIDEGDAISLRNAAIAAINVSNDVDRAAAYYDRAIILLPTESRLWLERDTLAERENESAASRLERLRRRPVDADPRDDLIVVEAELLCAVGRPGEAYDLLASVDLQPWEGGEGRAVSAWEIICLTLAAESVSAGNTDSALILLDQAEQTPGHLGEARHLLAGIADILVARGDILALLGDQDAAKTCWQAALADPANPLTGAPVTPKSFWVGAAAHRLGEWATAISVWDALDLEADRIEARRGVPDYFATSLPSTLLFDSSVALTSRESKTYRTLASQGRTLP